MSEQVADVPERKALLVEFDSIGMPEAVWMAVLLDTDPAARLKAGVELSLPLARPFR